MLGIAIVVSIVGMVYIVTLVFLAIASYIVIYWIAWRVLLKNFMAAYWPGPKTKKSNEDLDR